MGPQASNFTHTRAYAQKPTLNHRTAGASPVGNGSTPQSLSKAYRHHRHTIYRPLSPKQGPHTEADRGTAHPRRSPRTQSLADHRELCFDADTLHVVHQAQTTLRRIPSEGPDAPQDHPKAGSRDRFYVPSRTLFGSTDNVQVDTAKPLHNTTTDIKAEAETLSTAEDVQDDTDFADTEVDVWSAGGTDTSAKTRIDCEKGATAYQKQGSQNVDEESSSQLLNIGYSTPQSPKSTSPSFRSDFRKTSTSKNGTTVLQNQDEENVEECRYSQLCAFDQHFGPQGPESPFRISSERSREDFRRKSIMKNGTTVLQNQDRENSEECRNIQLCVFEEHSGHQSQDSQSRTSMASSREDFQRQRTMNNSTTVFQNQDEEHFEECREAQLCVSERYPLLIEVTNRRISNFYEDNEFDFENTAQAYPETIEQKSENITDKFFAKMARRTTLRRSDRPSQYHGRAQNHDGRK